MICTGGSHFPTPVKTEGLRHPHVQYGLDAGTGFKMEPVLALSGRAEHKVDGLVLRV